MLEVPKPTRAQRRQLVAENRTWPKALRQIPKADWPPSSLPEHRKPNEAWRSQDFLVSVYYRDDGVERLSVNRTT